MRTKSKITQLQLGDALAVSRNYVNMIENNKGNVGASTERLCEIINIIYKLDNAKQNDKLKETIEELNKINKKNKE